MLGLQQPADLLQSAHPLQTSSRLVYIYIFQVTCVIKHLLHNVRALRSFTAKLLQVPRTNLRFGSHPFHISTATLWNSLPHSIRFCESLTTFWKHLKTFFKRHSLTPPVPQIQFLISALYKFTHLLIIMLLSHTAIKLIKQYHQMYHYCLSDLRNYNSLCTFKNNLKTFLYRRDTT